MPLHTFLRAILGYYLDLTGGTLRVGLTACTGLGTSHTRLPQYDRISLPEIREEMLSN